MSNKYDYPRLSTFVGGIVDKRVRSIALAITSSVGYLKTLVVQSQTAAQASASSANDSQTYASSSSASSASAMLIFNNFTSTYVGVRSGEANAQKSSLNNPLTNNSFYIRSSDGHLRYVAAIDPNSGTVTWQDATVAIDSNSIFTAGDPRYLMLNQPGATQVVKTAVTFQGPLVVPSVTDWTSSAPPRASDVESHATGAVNAEKTRATNAEGGLSDRINQNVMVLDTVVDFSNGFQCGSNSNGYWSVRPDGVIEQWGKIVIAASNTSIDGSTINFPITFGNPSSVVVTGNSTTNTSSTWTENVVMFPGGPDNSGGSCPVIIGTSNQNQTVKNNVTVMWRAIGLRGTPAGGNPAPANSGSSGTDTGGTPTPTNTGGGGITSDPGTGTGTGGGHLCPEDNTPVLLANAMRTGPGNYVPASQLHVGDYVWTRHEKTMEWGAYQIIQAKSFLGELWSAPGYYRATKGHPLYINDQWTTIDQLGEASDAGTAVAITVDQAHTFISLNHAGDEILNHNVKEQTYDDTNQ